MIGLLPWRCEACHERFYARVMPLGHALRAHCPICGNQDLQRISAEYAEGMFSGLWRLLRVPAYRCEPCRHKYFSILPASLASKEIVKLPTVN